LSHSITSSARASRVGDTLMPSLFCRFEVYREFELGWLLNWQVARFLAAKNPIDVRGRASKKLRLRLGGDPADDEYPDKPPRMRSAPYNRLMDRLVAFSKRMIIGSSIQNRLSLCSRGKH
jgi:hypothetical protein